MINETRIIPRVLIAAPTSIRHGHLLNEWVKHLDSLSYPNFDVCLVDTSGGGSYFKRLQKKKLSSVILQLGEEKNQRKVFERKIILMKHKWNIKDQHPIQMLAEAREKIRQYFLENDYDYLFWLDDDIFIPTNGIQRLIKYKKDNVGFYVHVFPEGMHKPCLLKSGEIIMGQGLEYFSFAEIDEFKRFVSRYKRNKLSTREKHLSYFLIKDKKYPQLLKIYGVGLGCLLCSRKVVESIKFSSHTGFVYGEDLWYFSKANEAGFDFWCDTNVRAIHKNTDWNIVSKSKKEIGFAVAYGPVNAKGIDIIDRRKK